MPRGRAARTIVMMQRPIVDVVVVGAGWAGLSAALVLRRHRIGALVLDGGPPRNAAAAEVHGVLGAVGRSAADLLATARDQVLDAGATIEGCRVDTVDRADDGFVLRGEDGSTWRARRIVLATGVRDRTPDIARFDEFFGRSVHVCPHCDGYEWRDRPIAVITWNEASRDFTSKVSHWSRDVTLVTDGRAPAMSDDERGELAGRGIAVVTGTVAAFEGDDGRLSGLRMADRSIVRADAAFFSIGEEHRTELAVQLGCRLESSGSIETDAEGGTSVPGVWAAGDVTGDSQFVPVAVAQGVKAAIDVYRTLSTAEPEHHPP
jgi:thioredoxin reductase